MRVGGGRQGRRGGWRGAKRIAGANPNQKTYHVNYYILRQIILPSDLGLMRAKSSHVLPDEEQRTCVFAQ